MSTSAEGNDPTDPTRGPARDPGREPEPGADPATGTGVPAQEPAMVEEPLLEPDSGVAAPERTDRPSGALGAETLALTALFLLAVTVLSSQLVQLFTTVVLIGGQPVPVDQVSQFSVQLLIGGGLAALTAILAGLALALASFRTRPWARWLAASVLIVSLLLVLLAVVAYVMMPAGSTPQPMPMPN